jgi:hypothetical protein
MASCNRQDDIHRCGCFAGNRIVHHLQLPVEVCLTAEPVVHIVHDKHYVLCQLERGPRLFNLAVTPLQYKVVFSDFPFSDVGETTGLTYVQAQVC